MRPPNDNQYRKRGIVSFCRTGDDEMNKFLDGSCRYHRTFKSAKAVVLDTPYFDKGPETLRENLRLQIALKHAVERVVAPQKLIDSIRNGIRG